MNGAWPATQRLQAGPEKAASTNAERATTIAGLTAEVRRLENELKHFVPKRREGADCPTGITLVAKHWNGERVFRLVSCYSIREWGRRRTYLSDWEGTCTICGGPFIVTAPKRVRRADQSPVFELATCEKHRMTPKESARIRFAHREERAAIFEEIKRAKLANSNNKDQEARPAASHGSSSWRDKKVRELLSKVPAKDEVDAGKPGGA